MAPATSANDSEQQSMSSDADTLSLTDSSVYVHINIHMDSSSKVHVDVFTELQVSQIIWVSRPLRPVSEAVPQASRYPFITAADFLRGVFRVAADHQAASPALLSDQKWTRLPPRWPPSARYPPKQKPRNAIT